MCLHSDFSFFTSESHLTKNARLWFNAASSSQLKYLPNINSTDHLLTAFVGIIFSSFFPASLQNSCAHSLILLSVCSNLPFEGITLLITHLFAVNGECS